MFEQVFYSFSFLFLPFLVCLFIRHHPSPLVRFCIIVVICQCNIRYTEKKQNLRKSVRFLGKWNSTNYESTRESLRKSLSKKK